MEPWTEILKVFEYYTYIIWNASFFESDNLRKGEEGVLRRWE